MHSAEKQLPPDLVVKVSKNAFIVQNILFIFIDMFFKFSFGRLLLVQEEK